MITANDTTQRTDNRILSGSLKALPLFLLIAFGFSWVIWIPVGLFIDESMQTPFILLGSFGPLLSAVLVSWLKEGKHNLKTWLRETFRLRVSVLWYLLGGLLLPFAIAALQYAFYLIFGGKSGFSFNQPWYLYIFSILPTALVGGGNEEPGWRGFAIPRLINRFHPITANIILGVIWMLWHLPLYLVGDWGGAGQAIGWFLLYAVALSIILTWLYYRSKKSILPAMLLHAGTNVVFQFFPMQTVIFKSHDFDFNALKTLVYWLFALVIILGTKGKLGTLKPETDPGEGPA